MKSRFRIGDIVHFKSKNGSIIFRYAKVMSILANGEIDIQTDRVREDIAYSYLRISVPEIRL